MKTIFPPKLLCGDTVGIISPSKNISGQTKTLNEAIEWLKNNGLNVKLGNNYSASQYNSAGSRYQRTEDINAFFLNPKIKAIFCTIGGDAANQTLDLINYEIIKSHPKIIIGYSDNTNLLLAIHSQTGLETFHGPNLIQIPTLTDISKQQLIKTLFKKDQQTIRHFEVIKPGIAEGKLLGGNLFIINNLKSTLYSPNYSKSILFWEDINDGLSSIEYQLHQLHLSGILSQISGMVIGHIVQTSNRSRPYKEIITDLTKQYKYPIIKTNCFGHSVKKFFTFPLGSHALIDTRQQIFQFT